MKKLTQIFTWKLNTDILPFSIQETIFFDIETTGFAPKNSKLYLIGLIHAVGNETFESVQFLAESSEDEASLLYEFFTFIKGYKNIVHFNGNGFDIPYLLAKCASFNLLYSFDCFTGYDLYKEACRYKMLLKTQNMKQKTLEEFLGIQREDSYSGGELINIYYDYLKTKDEKTEKLLLLHNLEDLTGMLSLLDIYAYSFAFSGNFSFTSCRVNDFKGYDGRERKELLLDFTLNTPVPQNISGGNDIFYLSLNRNLCKIKILIRTDELKFFYPDYKNYYYLPKEDCAIHKSVAFYVDRNYRTQAKAATCYSKKTGCFLPEYEEIIRPYFKAEYHDKVLYFEADQEFLSDPEKLKAYALHVMQMLLK